MRRPGLWLPLASLWLLALLTFTLPGRSGPETLGALDPLALAKVAARAAVGCAAFWVVLACWDHPRRRLVAGALVPLLLFSAWAILSVGWSPLKAFSLGQAAGLAAQMLLAMLVGIAASRHSDTLRVVFHLNAMLLSIAVILLCMYAVFPDIVGFERGAHDGATGAVHPTSAGATASLGLIVLLSTKLIWGPRWSNWLLLPGLPVHSGLLLLAGSRMAIVMTFLILAITLPALLHRVWFASVVLAAGVLGAVYLTVNPGLTLAESMVHSTTRYMRRDQSPESLQSFTGRTELWDVVWREFARRPVQGYGYFVTSRRGEIDVWGRSGNFTAHNLLLQVAASTGLIGVGLFLWGFTRLLRRASRDLAASKAGRQFGVFLLLIGGWYLGWSQLSESFMGPIQPESLVFFYCMGIALAGLRIAAGDEAGSRPAALPYLESARATP